MSELSPGKFSKVILVALAENAPWPMLVRADTCVVQARATMQHRQASSDLHPAVTGRVDEFIGPPMFCGGGLGVMAAVLPAGPFWSGPGRGSSRFVKLRLGWRRCLSRPSTARPAARWRVPSRTRYTCGRRDR